jgi:hypothetical protein
MEATNMMTHATENGLSIVVGVSACQGGYPGGTARAAAWKRAETRRVEEGEMTDDETMEEYWRGQLLAQRRRGERC